jgi:hypothetical protein
MVRLRVDILAAASGKKCEVTMLRDMDCLGLAGCRGYCSTLFSNFRLLKSIPRPLSNALGEAAVAIGKGKGHWMLFWAAFRYLVGE